MKIATIINYCSNEYRFLKHCIEEAKQFSHQILITVCDHFFDGSEEKKKELENTFGEFPDCQFLYYPYIVNMVPDKLLKKVGDNFCCTFSRLIGFSYLKKEVDYILFLDADEIVEADAFQRWAKIFPIQNFDAIRLSNYWYFREAKYQATSFEDSAVLARKNALSRKVILQDGDRNCIFENVKGKTTRDVKGVNEKPFVHHFSWVRTKEEMLKKVSTWGHRNERDWKTLVEKEFSQKFSGKDFVHEYKFIEVDPIFDIHLNSFPPVQKNDMELNVLTLSKKNLFQILGIGVYKLKRLFL